MYERQLNSTLLWRLTEGRRFIEVLAGARQVGKTTSVLQVIERLPIPGHYASADEPTLRTTTWIDEQWEVARFQAGGGKAIALVLDEIHKVPGWSERVKALWDEDSRRGADVRVVLLGSFPLLVESGMTESLHGRFEVIRATHWSFTECREAFGWDLDTYIFYGGYPGAAPLIGDWPRWRSFILESLIETTLTRDVLLMTRVDKPALLRQLLNLACEASGRIVTYSKLVGDLRDAGNTTTLAHYLDLLAGVGLVTGLQKYSRGVLRRRASSPKLAVLNSGLMTAVVGRPFGELREDPAAWGRVVESAVGAHLLACAARSGDDVWYWRQGDFEIDFVVAGRLRLAAVEVKSNEDPISTAAADAFSRKYQPDRVVLVGERGIPVREFLERDFG